MLARINPMIYRARSRIQPGTKGWDKTLLAVILPAMVAIVPVAALALFFGMALALGSFWALVPAMLAPVLLVLRTSWEDRLLQAELSGYAGYARRVRWRLLPGLW